MKIFFLIFSISIQSSFASIPHKGKELTYRTSFGRCPSKTTGELAIDLVNKFEEKKSLASLKKYMIDQKLKERHYLSSYKIHYNPLEEKLLLDFDCPEILAKVQVYKKDGSELYNAVLVETGEIIDPNYEVFSRRENKLEGSLPFLSLPYNNINDERVKEIASYLSHVSRDFKSGISEIILDDSTNLTLVISNRDQAISVFMGKDEWVDKTQKLSKTLEYFKEKEKLPSIIKFSSSKKIVVKFSRNL